MDNWTSIGYNLAEEIETEMTYSSQKRKQCDTSRYKQS